MSIQMKDSGVNWMGKIPKHWEVKRVKDCAKWQVGFTPNSKKPEFYNGNDTWITIADLKDKKVEQSKNKINGDYFINKNKIPVNSLLFSFKLSIGKVSFNKKEVFTNEAICSFLRSSNINLDYFYYAAPICIPQNANINIYNALILNQDLIRKAFVFYPPLQEQQQIANYLDKHTQLIDKEIVLLREKSKLLKQYKQSIIYETVVKGLDKNVQMKDSGVNWMGKIPEHWEVKKVKNLNALKIPKLKLAPENSSNYLELGDVDINNNDYNIDCKEKLSVKGAKIGKKGNLIISTVRPNRGCITILKYTKPISSSFCVFESKSKFWLYFFKTKGFLNELMKSNTGTTYPTCKNADIYNQIISEPPFQEQQKIANYLDTKTININKKQELIKQKIMLLENYKQSLIYEVVTGKKQVKDI